MRSPGHRSKKGFVVSPDEHKLCLLPSHHPRVKQKKTGPPPGDPAISSVVKKPVAFRPRLSAGLAFQVTITFTLIIYIVKKFL
jgi:hypothetical protein